MDGEGRILGPISLEVVQNLASEGRVNGFHKVSSDGKNYLPVTSFPEVANTLLPPALAERRRRDLQHAQRLHLELDRFQELKINELFGVRKNATEGEYRIAFRALASSYRPANLSPSSHPELLKACTATFNFLSQQMRRIEEQFRAPADTRSVHDDLSRYLSLQRGSKVALTVQVNESSAALFMAHRTLNIESQSMFLSTADILPLGTRLELIFRFLRPPKDIHTRGVVVWENPHVGPEPVGYGVRMDGLPANEVTFIRDFVKRAMAM
jgi:hypothetical protein